MTSRSEDPAASRLLITPFEAVRLTACRITARILNREREPLSAAVVLIAALAR